MILAALALEIIKLLTRTRDFFVGQSHYAQRVPCECGGHKGVQDEGGIPHGGRNLFQIPRAAIVPRASECSNLVVPVCVSSTHIGLSAVRLERERAPSGAFAQSLAADATLPLAATYMILGESSGILAALSAKHGMAVQDVPYDNVLKPRLLAARQLVDMPPPPPPPPPVGGGASARSGGVLWWDGTFCDS